MVTSNGGDCRCSVDSLIQNLHYVRAFRASAQGPGEIQETRDNEFVRSTSEEMNPANSRAATG